MSGSLTVGTQPTVSNLNPHDEIRPASRPASREVSLHNQELDVRRSPNPPKILHKVITSRAEEHVAPELPEKLRTELEADSTALRDTDRERQPLDFARKHFAMEGRLLAEFPEMSFGDMQIYLEKSFNRPLHPWINSAEEISAIDDAVSSGHDVTTLIEDFAKSLGERLVVYDDMYKDVLKTLNDEPDSEEKSSTQKLVQKSHEAFQKYALASIDHLANQVPAIVKTFLESRLNSAKEAAERPGMSDDDRTQADQLQSQWQSAHDSFIGSGGVFEGDRFKNSLQAMIHNIGLQERIAALKADSGVWKGIQVFVSNGLPQAVASTGHFGVGRTALNQHTQEMGWHPMLQGFVNGLGLGAVHKFMTDVPRAGLQALLDRWCGGSLVKVHPTEVYPDKPRFTYEGGIRKALNADDIRNDQAAAESNRAHLLRDQGTGYFGTFIGDNIYHMGFGILNVLGTVYAEFGNRPDQSLLRGTLESGTAGLVSGGMMGLTKSLTTSGPDQIPTHKRKPAPLPGLTNYAKKAFFDFIPLKGGDGLSDWVGKLSGAVQGEFIATSALGCVRKRLNTDSPGHKVGRIFLDLASAPAILSQFLPNVEATAKAAAEEDGLEGSGRVWLALNDITQPNRRSKEQRLKFTDPTLSRGGYIADTFTSINTFSNGLARLVPQTLVSGQKWLGEKMSGKKETGVTPELGTEMPTLSTTTPAIADEEASLRRRRPVLDPDAPSSVRRPPSSHA